MARCDGRYASEKLMSKKKIESIGSGLRYLICPNHSAQSSPPVKSSLAVQTRREFRKRRPAFAPRCRLIVVEQPTFPSAEINSEPAPRRLRFPGVGICFRFVFPRRGARFARTQP